MIYIFFLLFILGTCLGSFISCVAYRYKLGISIIYPRSFCDNCSQTLQHWQLIPIIGFILQKGKCHFCKQKIPLSSTVIELAIGVIFIFNTIIIANTNVSTL
ncbi:prepilin peptidase [Ligilactobacillus salivarius]|uniref:prepilin peptidase n=1 Tax=Ligilactobacillus salivarius TaxID=1624 RepID=UPI001F50B580|nr:prepilin peptidase [Ligilactobacillus salivarius]